MKLRRASRWVELYQRDLRNARLIEFVEYAPRVDEDELARLMRRGAVAWKDVHNATAWVDELRGLPGMCAAAGVDVLVHHCDFGVPS